MTRTRTVLGLFTLLSLPACGVSTGTLTTAIYGEAFIEEGTPAAEFIDGWSIRYSKFIVSIGEMSWGRTERAPELAAPDFYAFDLTVPSAELGQVILSGEVPAGAYPAVTYRVAPLPAGATLGNAVPADRAAMQQLGYSIYIQGTATKGARSIELDWGFDSDVRFGDCESTAEVPARPRSQITIHSDHLYLDDLTAEEPSVTFDLMADADDGDGTLTVVELDAVILAPLPNYQVGSRRLGDKSIETLGDFVRYLVTTIGHIDGEGHCEAI